MCTNNRKWRTKLEAMGFEQAIMSASRDFEVEIRDEVVHCSVQNAAVSCVNQRERFTQY